MSGSSDDRDFDIIDSELEQMFSADQHVPIAFTACVLRRIQEAHWKNEMFLTRALYSGVVTIGVLMIVATWIACGALAGALQADGASSTVAPLYAANLSGSMAMKIAMIGLALTGLITCWGVSRLRLD